MNLDHIVSRAQEYTAMGDDYDKAIEKALKDEIKERELKGNEDFNSSND